MGLPAMSRNSQWTYGEPAVLFMHLHKTGGTTLSKVIDAMYPPHQVFSIQGRRFRESIEDFKSFSPSRRSGFKVVKGHMFFGLHLFIPRPSFYITLLRHPLERIHSLYYWALERPNVQYHKQVAGRGMSMEQFLESGLAPAADNGMVRFLSGCDVDTVPYGRCTDDLLDIAKRNLSEWFPVFGLTEFFDETLILLKRSLGWEKMPFYLRKNVTEGKPRRNGHGMRSKAAAECTRLDLPLYEYARERYHSLVAVQGGGFREEVLRFKELNSR
jgi:Galactose-3-O-sulfotransferase